MNIIKKINQSMGFTQNESRIIIFLVCAFIVGGVIKLYMVSTHTLKQFDYSVSDSIFAARSRLIISPDSSTSAAEDLPKTDSGAYPNPFGTSEDVKGKIHLNTATKQQLITLPGIGESTADLILEYRKKHGRFKSLEDLGNIHGIGRKKIERLSPYLTL